MLLSKSRCVELVVVTLATYSYALEKAWGLRDALEKAGLCDPLRVLGMDGTGLGNALKAAGYDRGGITHIIAPRLLALMGAIQEGKLDALEVHLKQRNEGDFRKLLEGVKGFGPTASKLAWALMSPAEAKR
ncbi:hypothetical protein L6R29_21930 [Myxococcota bacterium]|nr:hypothetical protein [Myxococcota bacterium]